MAKVLIDGKEYDFDAVVNLMDDDVREDLHSKFSPCTEQEYVDQYVIAHVLWTGKHFEIN